ncbi:hypothetical protein [Nostoc sp.]
MSDWRGLGGSNSINLPKQNSGVRSQNNASGTLREQHEFCTTGG